MLKSSNPYREMTDNKSSEKNLNPTGNPTLTLAQVELLFVVSAQCLRWPMQYCIPQLGTTSLSLSDQLLSGRWTLMTSGISLQLLALNHCFSPAKYRIPSEALCYLCAAVSVALTASLQCNHRNRKIFLRPYYPCPSLTTSSSLALSLAAQRCYSGVRSASEIELLVSQVCSPSPIEFLLIISC